MAKTAVGSQRIKILGGSMTAVASLKESEGNPRIHAEEQMKALVDSISKFGFTIPVLIDEKNVVLAGHARLAAAKRMGMEKVPTIKKGDWNAEQKKAFRIIDNELALMSDWDPDMLADELAALSDMGVSVEDMGFPDMMIGADPVMEPALPPPPEQDEERTQKEAKRLNERDAERRAAPEPAGKEYECPKCGAKFVSDRRGRQDDA